MATRPQQEGGASAPSNVTPIRRRVKVPKVNRPEDRETISMRRIRDAMHDGVIEHVGNNTDAATDALCIEWRAEAKLPRNNLRCIVRPDVPPEQAFRIAYWRACVAIAEFNLVEAQFSLAYAEDDNSADAWRERRNKAAERKNHAIEDCMRTPATKRFQNRQLKVGLIKEGRAFGDPDHWERLLEADDERLTREIGDRKARRA